VDDRGWLAAIGPAVFAGFAILLAPGRLLVLLLG
jgi:hypothetical protein